MEMAGEEERGGQEGERTLQTLVNEQSMTLEKIFMAIMSTEEMLDSSERDNDRLLRGDRMFTGDESWAEGEGGEQRDSLQELKGWFDDKEVTQQLDEEMRTAIDLDDVTTDKVTKSLEQARLLKTSLQQISDSLITTAHSDHKVLRKKLSEQFFSFNSQVNRLVESLERQDKNNKRLTMMTLVLKEKLRFREEQLWRAIDQDAVRERRKNGTDIENQLQSLREAPSTAQTAQMEWELAKTKTELEELRAVVQQKEEEKKRLQKQLTEALQSLAMKNAEADQAFLAEIDMQRDILVASRRAVDGQMFADLSIDDDKIDKALQQIPHDIRKLQRASEQLQAEKSKIEEESQAEAERLKGFLAALENKVKFQSKQIQTLKNNQAKMSGNVFQQTLQALKSNQRKPGESKQTKGGQSVENSSPLLDDSNDQEESYPSDASPASDLLAVPSPHDDPDPEASPSASARVSLQTRHVSQSRSKANSKALSLSRSQTGPDNVKDFDDVGTFFDEKLTAIQSEVSRMWQKSGMKRVQETVREVRVETARRVSETFSHLSEMKSLKDLRDLVAREEEEERTGDAKLPQSNSNEMREGSGGARQSVPVGKEEGVDAVSSSRSAAHSKLEGPRKVIAQKLEERWKIKSRMWEAKKEEIRRKRAEAIARCMGAFAIVVDPLSPPTKEPSSSSAVNQEQKPLLQEEKRSTKSPGPGDAQGGGRSGGNKPFSMKTVVFSGLLAPPVADKPTPRDHFALAKKAVMKLKKVGEASAPRHTLAAVSSTRSWALNADVCRAADNKTCQQGRREGEHQPWVYLYHLLYTSHTS
ncbi:hypothetical protein GUITHDRAFT_135339 [Guillardia theta CCMP2712]|uniref:Uncharacterized protein n=1 Tax=Guillardia theta (strain CCMP2712) TaxID=905079 RepID=L1JNJ2_GUITC|nr:hypothetical protein GUITHDRAFT_135339 [Guillardia theta CCMP2712]EKX50156.1 hypothetical protein GUITHDRAFT_135339 [Guillardia theta CCMP2712]|eukprot:XP_005837136.1 hypothetical protein GUITHDRAFT_135339 [Guillardia theta CCMP2712]